MRLCLLEEIVNELSAARSQDQVAAVMVKATHLMGFDHFAISYDQWSGTQCQGNLLVHDYPDAWARVYVDFDLYNTDPVRRCCEHNFTGFPWRDMKHHIALTRSDITMLSTGTRNGIMDGYTVPRHLPGVANGSCTFVVGHGKSLPNHMLHVAEGIGAAALAAAKGLVGIVPPAPRSRLSDRQRNCVLWSARGLSAIQIAERMGIKPATVIQHLRTARDRYEVHCSEALILCALFDGLISFSDVFRWWYSEDGKLN